MGLAPLRVRRRRGRRWVAGLVLLLAVVPAAAVYWRLPLAEMALRGGLAYAGIDGVAFAVTRLDGEGATVTRVRADAALRIDSVDLAWNRDEFFHRPLAAVTVVDGRLDFSGAGAAFWSRLTARGGEPRAPAALARILPRLPAVEAQRMTVLLPAPHGVEALAVDGAFRPQGSGGMVHLGVRTPGDDTALNATVTLSGLAAEPSLSLTATITAGLDSVVRRVAPALPLAGRVRVELAGMTPLALPKAPVRSLRDVLAAIGRPSLEATVFLDGVRWGTQLDGVDGRADLVLSLDADATPQARGRLRLGAGRAAVAAASATDLRADGVVAVRLADGAVTVTLPAPLALTAAGVTVGRAAVGPLSLTVTGAAPEALRLGFAGDPLRRIGAALAVSSQSTVFRLDGDPAPATPPLAAAGTVRLADGTARFLGQVTGLGGGLAVAVDARHDLIRQRGRAHVSLEPLRFGPAGVQPGQIAPALGRFSAAAGTLDGAFDLNWGGGRADGTGRVRIDGLDIADSVSGASFSGLSGAVAFDRLMPPSTPPGQELRLARLDAGVALKDMALRFRILADAPDAPVVAVDSLGTSIAGGRLTVAGGRVGAGGDATVPLRLTGVDLATVFDLVGVEGLGGTGTVDGMIPITVAGGRLSVAGGRLVARGPGRLRLRLAAVRQALASAGQEVTWMLQALEDFRYDRLSLAIEKAPEGIARLRLETLGSNPAVLEGRPFAINLNLEADVDRIATALVDALRLPGRLVGTIVRGSR